MFLNVRSSNEFLQHICSTTKNATNSLLERTIFDRALFLYVVFTVGFLPIFIDTNDQFSWQWLLKECKPEKTILMWIVICRCPISVVYRARRALLVHQFRPWRSWWFKYRTDFCTSFFFWKDFAWFALMANSPKLNYPNYLFSFCVQTHVIEIM